LKAQDESEEEEDQT